MKIDEFRPIAEKLFAEIRALSFDGVGISRDSYGDKESATADYLSAFAEENGLQTWRDRAANLRIGFPDTPADSPVIWCGSHIDSVPQGGNFDGLAGVTAGLLCLLAQQRSGRRSPLPLQVIGLRGEESAWFGKAYMGSSALLGKLDAEDLALRRRGNGETLGEAMQRVGADIDAIREQQRLFDPKKVRAFLELHIEQGPVMEARKLPVAVVSGIRGNIRHGRMQCLGEAGHSGTIPRWLRRDAVFAVSDLIMRLDGHWSDLLERGTDLVVTVGMLSTDAAEHAASRIPGQVTFSFEARSKSLDTLEAFYQLMRAPNAPPSHANGRCVSSLVAASFPARRRWIRR
ncbi:M20/M25/M40 family metallo-hydrolase [Dentiradicibacter hellwigii]|uniref:M20/M25/M40 family metallo-hydrolase n=1 Tax=Dentiradicibacter hellwigii TaxID=3149053 RepID=A0ABV4UDT5_9RHOO